MRRLTAHRRFKALKGGGLPPRDWPRQDRQDVVNAQPVAFAMRFAAVSFFVRPLPTYRPSPSSCACSGVVPSKGTPLMATSARPMRRSMSLYH